MKKDIETNEILKKLASDGVTSSGELTQQEIADVFNSCGIQVTLQSGSTRNYNRSDIGLILNRAYKKMKCFLPSSSNESIEDLFSREYNK